MIKQYVQGSEALSELYCAIGGFAISEEVHKALGVPVTGRCGDIWLVSFDKEAPMGFAQLRILKGKECHIRYLYADNDKHALLLAKAAIAAARAQESKLIFTNDRDTSLLWGKFGFKLIHKQRGSFGRWERELI